MAPCDENIDHFMGIDSAFGRGHAGPGWTPNADLEPGAERCLCQRQCRHTIAGGNIQPPQGDWRGAQRFPGGSTKIDKAKGYTQIRTPAGVKGWIQSFQLTDTPSSQEQLAGVRQELERLQAQHAGLKQHMDDVVNRPEGESLSYPQLYEEALRLRQQLAQYRKVASDTVAIDERNKVLQERVVTLERELQIVQQENQALRDDNGSLRFLIGALLLGVVLLVAVLTPKIREQRRAQWSRL